MAEALQGDFATKSDTQALRSDLRETTRRLEAKIEAMKNDLIGWFVGIAFAQSVLIVMLAR